MLDSNFLGLRLEVVTSTQNKNVKLIAGLKEKKHRDTSGLFVLEGERAVNELPGSWQVERLVISESFAAEHRGGKMIVRAKAGGCEAMLVSDRVFGYMSETETPQGILAVCRQKKYEISELELGEQALLLLAERISDPGNLGTLLRCADASGCDAVILSQGSADVYNPKALRATAGSVFHLPIVTNANFTELIPLLQQMGVRIFAAHLNADTTAQRINFKGACGIMIGNEASGLSDAAASLVDALVKIPMPGRAESLNASVAAGILLYEAVRQRSE